MQVFQSDSTLVAGCKKLRPIAATREALASAQVVYNEAILLARSHASDVGADAIVVTNSDHTINGLMNVITVHAVALSCY